MKYLFTTLTLLLSFSVFSQRADILTANNENIKVKIQGFSDSHLFTNKGNFEFKDLFSITFYEEVSDRLLTALQDNGVGHKISSPDDLYGVVDYDKPTQRNPPTGLLYGHPSDSSDPVDLMMHQIQDSHSASKLVQAIGVMLLASSMVVSVSEIDDLDKIESRRNSIKFLSISGGFFFFVGVGIETSSHNKLLLKIGK